MSQTEIAKQAGAICVGATALAFGVTAGATLGAIAALNLAVVWRDLKSGCVRKTHTDAVVAVLQALEKNSEFREEDLACAAGLLSTLPKTRKFDPEDTVPLLATDRFVPETAQKLVDLLDPDPKTPAIADILRLAFSAGLSACLRSDQFRSEMTWDVALAILQKTHRHGELLKDLASNVDELKAGKPGWSRDFLEILATRFGIETPYDLTDGELRKVLTQKAAEYRDLRKQIESLDDRARDIADLKRAAQDAVDNLDFDAVERILSRADVLETACAAETKVARARNALLRNDVELAFTVLSSAANSFASVDKIAPANFRLQYEDLLFQNGKTFGGSGLVRAVDMNLDALKTLGRGEHPDLWATAHNNIGVALRNQGERDLAPETLRLAAQHIALSLEVRTVGTQPKKHAVGQNNLSAILTNFGCLTSSELHLHGAIAAAEITLALSSPNDRRELWVSAQTNRANALCELTTVTDDIAFAVRAADTYRDLARVLDQRKEAVTWALVKNNLGDTLTDIAIRKNDQQAAREAISALQQALAVRTLHQAPVDFAKSQNNLGRAWGVLGELTADLSSLGQALKAFAEALKVRDPNSMPFVWAETKGSEAVTHLRRAQLLLKGDAKNALDQALMDVDAVLTIYSPQDTPDRYRKATALRDFILADLDALP